MLFHQGPQFGKTVMTRQKTAAAGEACGPMAGEEW